MAAPVNPGQLFAWVNTFGERSGFGPALAGIVWGENTHGASLTVAYWSPQTGTLGNQRGISKVLAELTGIRLSNFSLGAVVLRSGVGRSARP